ncbi:peptide chain release factor 2 [Candidatus Phytoplasma prunorum]|uniref:peptide chain release factor 2 n=1 Tax=Candidatus Phytoplasma prunorum TaxID=47565 RepID=UPI002FF06CAE
MEKYEINLILDNLKKILYDLEIRINLNKQKKRLKDLNNLINLPNFWDNFEKAKKINQEFKSLNDKIYKIQKFNQEYQYLSSLLNITKENMDDFLFLEQELLILKKNIQDFEIKILLNQTYDKKNAILILHPGAGGIESQDWCEMLFRMYRKYAQKKNFKIEILDYQIGDVAGLKSVSLLIKGLNAYGYLKSEKGVHRLVRISPFDSNSKRHTSFTSCDVLPEINENIEIKIKEEDIKIDVFRSSGAGGQHINTTDSAVRITHLPTNIIVNCQNERSQTRNKEQALQILKTKLFQREIKKQEINLKLIQGVQKEISWGNQIRSYIFHPYQLVKDHRTNVETYQIELVMDGDLDLFISSFLKKNI